MVDRKAEPWNVKNAHQDFEIITVEIPVSGQFGIAIRRSCNKLRLAMDEIISSFITGKIATFLPHPDRVADSIEHGTSFNECLAEGLKEFLHVKERRSRPWSKYEPQEMKMFKLNLELPKLLVDAMRSSSAKTGTTLAEIITIFIHDSFNYRVMTT